MRSLLLSILLSLLLVSPAIAGDVRLSAAASMTDAVKALVTTFKQNNPDVNFQTNFASSGILAKQISLGAPADLFISANPKWMDYLVAEQSIETKSVRTLAGNSLIFIGRKELDIPSLDAIARLELIAIGSPKSVPAGQYAEQALRAAGLYERMQGKLVVAKDVRQALIYAERGETDGAFVYKTDALLAQATVMLLEVPQEFYAEINYPVGLTFGGAQNPAAVAFFDFLKTAAARSLLKKFGFTVK